MSGGIAYVLDVDGMFDKRCNLAMVDLEPITDENDALEDLEHQGGDLEAHGLVDVMHDLTRYDELRLKTLIEAHRRYTGSARATEVLENWSDYRGRFVKVMPVEYRKALQKMQQRTQEEAGVSVAVGA